MAQNTTDTLDKLFCTSYVDIGKCQDGYCGFSWSKNDSNNLGVKLKVLKSDDNRDFRLVQNLTRRETGFNQLM